MIRSRRLLTPAALALSVAGGVAAGALIGAPVISGAEDGAPPDPGPGGPVAHSHPLPTSGPPLADVAEHLDLSVEELHEALRDGASIAEVAEARGIAREDLVDALVADAVARLEALEAELPATVEALVARDDWAEHRLPGARPHASGWADGPRAGVLPADDDAA